MIGFRITGNNVKRFMEKLKICKPYTSLGDVASLLTWYEKDDDRGIPDKYIRFSVGIEDVEDIIYDLNQSLKLYLMSTLNNIYISIN